MKRSDFLTGIVASAAAAIMPAKAGEVDAPEPVPTLPPLPKPDRIVPMWPHIFTGWNKYGVALYTTLRLLDKTTGKYYLCLHKQEHRYSPANAAALSDVSANEIIHVVDSCHRRLHVEIFKCLHLHQKQDLMGLHGEEIHPFDTRQETEEERAKRML